MFDTVASAPRAGEVVAAPAAPPQGWTAEDEWLLAMSGPGPREESQPPRAWASDSPEARMGLSPGWVAFELDGDTADPALLSDADLVDAITGFERIAAWALARQARVTAEFARRRPRDDGSLAGTDRVSVTSPFAPDEVGLALRLSRWSATARIGQSVELVERLPETLELWEAGRLDERRVTAICDATRHLPAEIARAVQARVLPTAPEQTLGRLKAALARAVIKEDPDGAAQRHREARRERRVAVSPERDGMASLWASLPAPDALASFQWLTRLARGMGSDDPRGMDARRADLLVGLLTGRLTHAHSDGGEPREDAGERRALPQPVTPGKPLVQVLMPFHVLLGADGPCELVGYGAIHADLAREIAADSTVKRLVFDPTSGALLDHGRRTYRPPAALADHVRARDVHCRNPICRRRVLDGELDHIVPFPLGPTAEHNLAGYCSHDHHAKHAPGWRVRTRPGRRLEWTTPTGHRYLSEPFDHRLDDEPPLIRPQPPPAPADADTDDTPPF